MVQTRHIGQWSYPDPPPLENQLGRVCQRTVDPLWTCQPNRHGRSRAQAPNNDEQGTLIWIPGEIQYTGVKGRMGRCSTPFSILQWTTRMPKGSDHTPWKTRDTSGIGSSGTVPWQSILGMPRWVQMHKTVAGPQEHHDWTVPEWSTIRSPQWAKLQCQWKTEKWGSIGLGRDCQWLRTVCNPSEVPSLTMLEMRYKELNTPWLLYWRVWTEEADLPSLHHILTLEEVSGWNGSTTSSTWPIWLSKGSAQSGLLRIGPKRQWWRIGKSERYIQQQVEVSPVSPCSLQAPRVLKLSEIPEDLWNSSQHGSLHIWIYCPWIPVLNRTLSRFKSNDIWLWH